MKTVSKSWMGVLLLALVVCPRMGRAQFNTPNTPINQINPNRAPDDIDARGGGESSFSREIQQRQIKRLRELHQHEVITDTARMEQLAAAMKDEVDKGNTTLNADVMKDAEEISRLAKRVSERIKSQ